jgi:transcriptional regulator with XRE-family HTH domain
VIDKDETVIVRTGRRLRDARLQVRMTVREVADVTGIDHSLIVKYENGTVAAPLERMSILARTYGLTAAALLAEQDAAVALLAAIDRASAPQLAQLAQLAQALESRPERE